MKKGIFIALGVTVFLAMALVVLLRSFDLNAHKPKLEAKASEVAGQPVRILGDARLGFRGLMPSLVLEQLRVGPERAPEATVGTVKAAVPLTALRALTAGRLPERLDLTLEKLTVKGRDLGDITAPVRFTGDNLRIDPLQADLPRGGELRAVIDYTARKLTATAEVKNIDYALIIPGASGGDIHGNLSLTGQGRTVDAILAELDGKVDLYGGSGTLSGDALTLWADDLLSAVLTGASEKTDVACMLLSGRIRNGVLVPSQALLDTARVQVKAKGQVDLRRQTLNLVVTPAPKQTALLSLATPLRVKGPWDAPQVAADGRAVVEKVGGMLLGAVAPPAALLPFVKKGAGDSPCGGKS